MAPDPQAVLDEFAALTPVLYRAYEHATVAPQGFFGSGDRPFDSGLHAHLVRYFARAYLLEVGEATELEPQELPNCGLILGYRGWQIRLRKGDHGGVPVPSRSRRIAAFYGQEIEEVQLTFWPVDRHPDVAVRNLIILWHPDHQNRLEKLSIALPRGTWAYGEPAELHRHVDIPHPAEVLPNTWSPSEEDDDLEDRIRLPDRRPTGTDHPHDQR